MTMFDPNAPAAPQGQPNQQQMLQQLWQQGLAAQAQLPGLYAQQQGALADYAKMLQQPQGGPDTAMLQLAQGFLAPTRTGALGESIGSAVGNYAGALTQQRAAEMDRAQKLAQLKVTQAQLATKLPEAQLDASKNLLGIASGMESLNEKGRAIAEREAQNKAMNDLIKSGQISPEIARVLPTMPPDERAKFLTQMMKPKDLTSTDRLAIQKNEQALPNLDQTISSLDRALELNDKTFTGYTAGARGAIGTKMWGGNKLVNEEAAKATQEWQNIMSQEAIAAMSASLKGATTDFELRKFESQLADPSTPPVSRKRMIIRMKTLAEQQRKTALDMNEQIRGGSFYKPGGGQSRPSQGAPAQGGAPSSGGDASAIIQSARDAIAKGADRNAVMKRLKDNGINPPGDL